MDKVMTSPFAMSDSIFAASFYPVAMTGLAGDHPKTRTDGTCAPGFKSGIILSVWAGNSSILKKPRAAFKTARGAAEAVAHGK